MKRKQGAQLPSGMRDRGLQMLRDGIAGPEIQRVLGVSSAAVSRWRKLVSKPGRKPGRKAPERPMVSTYLAKQLEIISNMIRAKLPELAKFSLTTTDDGTARVEYAMRQTTLVTGSVKL